MIKKVLNKLQKYKINTSNQINNSETNFWTYDEFNKFISVVDDEFYNILFTFLYMTGLRIGELQALKWIVYNSKNKTLRINKSLTTNIFDVSYAIVDPKTSNSFRIVDIDNNVCYLLDKLKNKSKLLYGFNEQFLYFWRWRCITHWINND